MRVMSKQLKPKTRLRRMRENLTLDTHFRKLLPGARELFMSLSKRSRMEEEVRRLEEIEALERAKVVRPRVVKSVTTNYMKVLR